MQIQQTTWNGFDSIVFEFESREATLVFPKNANKSGHFLLKTEYFGAFPDFEIEMLHRGWHLAHIANKTRWCLDEDLDIKARFIDYLHREYALDKRCVPVGMSCGGLIASKLAARHPECVSVLYLDAPVMNLLSCPAGVGRDFEHAEGMLAEFTGATGITLSQLTYYREHPIDKMPILLENGVPIVMVYGDSDTVVPYEENGAILERYYKENGGDILTIGKAGCGHHPHGLEDSTPIIEFIENRINN